MLERLIDLLRTGRSYRIADLARELDTTPALIEAMLERLEQMGYLRQICGDAGGWACRRGCAACVPAGVCVAGSGRAWVLTEKGMGDRQ
ncbi:MAG: FeoC-like transcriptional regulator [Anaerolineae bacterium]|nr:FeoC-like transcriptional regulator [Anaerolineae bacterium]